MTDYPPQGTGSPPLSPATTVTDETVYGVAPAVGAATTYAREDHAHGSPAAPSIPAAAGAVTSETAYDQAANAGAAATFSRGDHTHGTPAKEIKNKGRAWIAHGDNVITLAAAQADTNYLSQATIHLPAMGGVTTRGPQHTNPMTPTTIPGTASRLLVRLHGGYGFSSCGSTSTGVVGDAVGTTARFDDVANTQTTVTAAAARWAPGGFSLNGHGFACGGLTGAGGVSAVTERFNDIVTSAWTARAGMGTARHMIGGYTLGGLGLTSGGNTAGWGGGFVASAVTERFDDSTNAWTARTGLTTARASPAAYGLNNYGFTSGGIDAGSAASAVTERFDDSANNHTARQNLNTARYYTAGFAMNGYGFTSCGTANEADPLGTTERLDDVGNIQTVRGGATARWWNSAFSLNGFGFTSGGTTTGANVVTTAERFDDVANAWTARTALAQARVASTGFATNEYFVNYITEDA